MAHTNRPSWCRGVVVQTNPIYAYGGGGLLMYGTSAPSSHHTAPQKVRRAG